MLLGAMALSSCEDAKYDTLTNQAYILQTNTDANSSQKLTIGNDPIVTSINVRLSDKALESSSYRIVYDAAALEKYNLKNETSYTALPESAFSLSSAETTIEAGTSVSSSIALTINPLTDEMKNSGKKYAMAFRLESIDGKANILSSGSVMVYVLDQVVIQPVVVLNNNNYIKQNFPEREFEVNEWTVEFNIYKEILGTAVGQYNNQNIFGAYPGEIYVRFGDAPIEGNRLQIKTRGTQMNSQMLFNTNTWYHIAFVCTGTKLYLYVNGILDNSMDLPGTSMSINEFFINDQSSYNKGDTRYSEFRFWNTARTQNEILNNMYVCDPATPGFIFYYKMNEGSGNTLHDVSGGFGDIEIGGNGSPTWIQDVRIDGKN